MATKSLTLPFKTRVQIALLTFITDFVRRKNGTINRRLMNLLELRVPPTPTPRNSVSSYDVVYNPSTNLYFRLFIPSKNDTVSSPLPILVFVHGGAFSFLSPSSFIYDGICRRLALTLNAVVCSVEYRLTPEYKFPCQYDDALTFLKFLNNSENLENTPHWPQNADVSCVFLAGDSAGGNIAHHLSVQYATSSSTSFSNIKVRGLVNIQPFFGGEKPANSEIELDGMPIVSLSRTKWLWRAFLGDGLDLDHWAVNVSGPNAVDLKEVKEYPPVLLVVGGLDPLKDWQKKYYEWLIRNGKEVKMVEYENGIHAFYVFPELPECDLVYNEVKEFVDKYR